MDQPASLQPGANAEAQLRAEIARRTDAWRGPIDATTRLQAAMATA